MASSLPNFIGVFARRLVFLFTFGLHASLFHTHATRVLLADATLVLYPLSTRSLKVKMLHSLFFVVADLHASAYNSYRAFLLSLLAPPIFVVTRLLHFLCRHHFGLKIGTSFSSGDDDDLTSDDILIRRSKFHA